MRSRVPLDLLIPLTFVACGGPEPVPGPTESPECLAVRSGTGLTTTDQIPILPPSCGVDVRAGRYAVHVAAGARAEFSLVGEARLGAQLTVREGDQVLARTLREPFAVGWTALHDSDLVVEVERLSGSAPVGLVWELDQAADDYGALSTAATALEVGAVASGALEALGDRDTFRVALRAGVDYDLRITSTATAPVTVNFLGEDGQPAGEPLVYEPYTEGLLWGVPASGEQVLSLSTPGAVGATYTLSVVEVVDDAHGNSPEAATALDDGAPVSGVVRRGDEDWLAFPVRADEVLDVSWVARDAADFTLKVPGQRDYQVTYRGHTLLVVQALEDGVLYMRWAPDRRAPDQPVLYRASVTRRAQ